MNTGLSGVQRRECNVFEFCKNTEKVKGSKKDGVVSYFSGRLCRPKSKKQKGGSLGLYPPMGETLVSLQITKFSFIPFMKISFYTIPIIMCYIRYLTINMFG